MALRLPVHVFNYSRKTVKQNSLKKIDAHK